VSRSIDVVANVRGRGLGAVTGEVKDRLRQVTFPREHHLEVLGAAQQRASAGLRVWTYLAGAAILIFFLLQAAFGSWRLAALYFLLLPVTLAGGLLLAIAVRGSVSVVALLGLLAVLAIAVRGGILQIRHYQRLGEDGPSPGAEDGPSPGAEDGRSPGADLVELGSRQRVVPTITGALAAGLALLPLAFYGDASGLETAGPLALIILGGLLTATLVNLFVLPVLYLRFAPRRSHAPE
jgi:Cu/Ag efflux pump CusA